MKQTEPAPQAADSRLPLNIAIVGGGRACRFFLELLQQETFPYLDVHLVGVCDIDPQAEGLRRAQQLGIYTTDNFKDLFEIPELDGIIELTNSRKVLLELIKLRPKRVGVVEHNIGRLLRSLFTIEQRLKSAEQQVAQEKLITEFLIQQANERIVVLNPDFSIDSANEAYLKAVGRTSDDAVGQYCYKVLYGLDSPCSPLKNGFECPMVRTLRSGESAHVIMDMPLSDGAQAFSDIVTYPMKDSDGSVKKVIEIYRDITQELSWRWEKKVAELKEDLNRLVQEDRMISLGKLVASCVHEINNPIQGLLTFAHLMRDMLDEGMPGSQDQAKMREFTSVMASELERCGDIVSGLLSFSRETPLEYKNIDLSEVIRAVLSLTRHKMELQNIALDEQLYPGLLMVKGNANRLQQCLLNLVFNAIEAMPEGGRLAVVSTLEREQDRVRVEIRDTGTGIPEADIDHLFDPFFTTKEAGKGTGLGLSIVYGVVKNHGGEIQVQTEVGRGSAFVLQFPRQGRT